MKLDPNTLIAQLTYLGLPFIGEHYQTLAQQAATQHWSHLQFLERLIEGQAQARESRGIERRVRLARFPLIKTLDAFQWDWPKKIRLFGTICGWLRACEGMGACGLVDNIPVTHRSPALQEM
jgi:hypothetical protein